MQKIITGFALSLALWTAHPAAGACRLDATLRGNNLFFLTFGRDSWQGPGLITCDNEPTLRVTVRYECLRPGVGFSRNYPLNVAIGEFSENHIVSLIGAFRLLDDNPRAVKDGGVYAMRLESSASATQFRLPVTFSPWPREMEDEGAGGQIVIQVDHSGE